MLTFDINVQFFIILIEQMISSFPFVFFFLVLFKLIGFGSHKPKYFPFSFFFWLNLKIFIWSKIEHFIFANVWCSFWDFVYFFSDTQLKRTNQNDHLQMSLIDNVFSHRLYIDLHFLKTTSIWFLVLSIIFICQRWFLYYLLL